MYQLPYTPHSASCLDNAVPCSTIVATKTFDSNNTLAAPAYTVGEKFFYHVSSPYTGYLYVFLTEPNGQTKLLYPNMYTPVSMYINAGTGVTLPSNTATYHLTIAPPLGEHTIFYYVLTQFVEADTFNAVTRKQDVDKIVENLGLTKNIYHGYGEGKFHAYER